MTIKLNFIEIISVHLGLLNSVFCNKRLKRSESNNFIEYIENVNANLLQWYIVRIGPKGIYRFTPNSIFYKI